MKNFIQPGHSVQIPAPGNVTGGVGVLTGTVFHVPQQTALNGVPVETCIDGVVDLPKAAVAIALFDLAYWDNGAKVVTNVSSGTTKIGIFTAAALAGASLGRVRLNGAF
jgi:predicted RecA/RadA family phage recombinase